MALQRLAGIQEYQPRIDHVVTANAPTFASVLLDALADRIAFVGRFVHKDRSVAKTVDGVGLLFGTNVKTNGSTLKVSLQDVSLTAGPPYQEDGTPDQTLSIANADAGFVSNAWYEAGFDGGATRSLTHHDRVAVVVQFDSFVAGDSVNIRGLALTTAGMNGESGMVANLTGAYAGQLVAPNVVLRCSDGTYGTIEGAFPLSALTAHSVNVATGTADEYAMGLQFPYPVALDGAYVYVLAGTAGEATELLLYSGTTALITETIDHEAIRSNAARQQVRVPFLEQTLAKDTLYRLAIRPTGTGNITIYSFDVANVAHFQCHAGEATWHQWTRLDQGAWGGEVTTRRLFAGVRPSAFDDGAQTGGGLLVNPGMQGGLRG